MSEHAGREDPARLRWYERLNALNLSLLLFAAAVVASAPVLRGSGRDLDYLRNLWRFLGHFFPPDFSASAQIVAALGETMQIAVMATAAAVVLSVPLAMAGARGIAPRPLNLTARMTLNVIRTIPSLIWALMAVAVVGPNPLAGVIGLTLYSLGYLGKFFSDAFESVRAEASVGLRAIGASSVQAFQYGLWPQAKPLIWSHALWMLEYNIRSASIIGYVGAGGIGVQLHTYQEYYQWEKFAAVLVYILALVTVLDLFGEWARRQIGRQFGLPKPA
jgi:phosphonate transport system permease protein